MTLHDPATPESAAPDTSPVIISHAEMNAAYDQGLVTPFGRTIAFAVRYQDTWWIHYEGGWIRTDKALADTLDTEASRMTAQDAVIARNAAIRAASRSTRKPKSGSKTDRKAEEV